MRAPANHPTFKALRAHLGFSLLELLCVLLISSLLLLMSASSLQNFWAQHRIRADLQIIADNLKSAQTLAVYSGQKARLCGDIACSLPWKNELFILHESNSVFTHSPLSGSVDITIQAFPIQIQNAFIFLSSGMTDYQSASIMVCYPGIAEGKKLVINVAGRVREEKYKCEELQ